MKVTIDLPDWIATALLAWDIPDDLAGPSIEERLYFLADDAALGITRDLAHMKQRRLYRSLGIAHPDDSDDEVPF